MARMIELVPGSDPASGQPCLRPAGTATLPRGWYLLESGAQSPDDRVAALRCGGDGEWQPVRALGGRRKSLFLVDASQRLLAVRAKGQWPLPEGPGFSARRIGSARALLAMLSGIARQRGVRQAVSGACAFVATSAIFGPRLALRQLFECYQAGIDGMDRGFGQRIWRVWTGWSLRPGALVVSPVAHAAGDSTAGGFWWRAEGGDAKLGLSRREGGVPVLPAGWYRLRGRIDAADGAWEAPQFSVRYAGQHQPLPTLVRFAEPGVRGGIDAPVRFDHDVVSLHLEPSVSPVRFRMDGSSLTRLGRLRWPLRLLLALRTREGARDWARIVRCIVDAASRLVKGQPGSIGGALADAYEDANRRYARSYELWVARYDTFTDAGLSALRERGQTLAASGPLVSILLPVFETPEPWLRRCLESVVAQAYPRWELCIADDASRQPHVRKVIEEFAKRDRRIRAVYRTENGHISAASNTALAMAGGEYVGLLDHDDELRPHAVLEMAEAIIADRRRRVLYSDEDKIDAMNRRFDPYFKPDWNPDLLLSQNYLCHFTVVETGLARGVGGFREGYEGSQDHDLVLRCTRGLADTAIHHVAKILYHWRAIPGSTALQRSAKDYASSAGARAVADHVRAIGFDASVENLAHGHYRVRWTLPWMPPKVSLIIPTRDQVRLLRTCVESVLASTTYPDFECIVVDNQSTDDEALEYLAEISGRARVRVLRHEEPFNYSRINNWAVAQCDGELVCLLNNDVEVIDPDWLDELAGQALRPGIGAVGAMLYYPDGTIQHAGAVLGLGGVANHIYAGQPPGFPGHGSRALVAQNLSAVTGACLMVSREAYERVGGLDERLQVAFNDVDFCLRLREAGYHNVWTPFARLYHHESASRGADDTPAKQQRFLGEVAWMQQRWGHLLLRDPAYNRNLSLAGVNAELSFPPRAD